MKRAIAGLLGLSTLLLSWGTTAGQPAPHMSGRVSAPECVDAMAVAKHMYASTATYVYAPLQMPDHLSSTMILGAMDVDISGGDAIKNDAGHFENPFPSEGPSSHPTIYWGKDVSAAGRIVVTAELTGWHGDVYSLYVLPGDVTPQQFHADLANNHEQHHYSPLIDGAWRAPLVFWSKTTQKTWFIDVGAPYDWVGQWGVYLPNGTGFKASCQIRFWPEERLARAPSILPNEVRVLANLLDQTLGYGPEQGTLQATATLRMYSQHIWRNAAYRPWALSDNDAYDSREQVDDGLLQWSHTGPSYARLHAQIKRAYPAAEAALARYYESRFKISNAEAKQAAHWVLDVAYRCNFVFSGGTPNYMQQENVSPNPWSVH